MTYGMASIIKKTLRGKTYYYARECRRIDGKPTIVWQKYLGKADDIVAALARPQPHGKRTSNAWKTKELRQVPNVPPRPLAFDFQRPFAGITTQ